MRALALLVALGALALAPAARGGDPPSAADLEAEIVCPVCETTLDQSNAPIAERMKLFIRERIAAGDSEQEIKDALVAEFGPGVLATPPKRGFGLLAWALPLAGLAAGIVVVSLLARSWARSRRVAPVAPPVEPELERRIDEELARFES
ncbi:MAG: cytochrome c-type biogenesis protein [Thermoleophilia bacterium]|nr:cytochrome c-type biogenesis protein CcmH [Gaiellaceae bacterium]MDW8338992.1 cytochrome c-type biogenesis protein [Thermoleophilia bacterium]